MKREDEKNVEVVPLRLREANDFVESFHRHNGRTARDGGKFAIGLEADGELVAIAIVGVPLSRIIAADRFCCEVLRTCVKPGAPRDCNSRLYGACWRVWRAMGGCKMVTYTLASESGSSLRGSGWRIVQEIKPTASTVGWNRAGRIREWQPIYGQGKFRWEIADANNRAGKEGAR